MQAQTQDAVLAALQREAARKQARENELREWIRVAIELFGDDEQPRVRLPEPGLWSAEWRRWDSGLRRFIYHLPKEELVSKRDYFLLWQYGKLPQLEAAWAALAPRLALTNDVPAATMTTVRSARNVDRYVARVKRAMVLVLQDNPNADLVGPGACAVVANKAGVTAKTMTNWFNGSEITLTKLLRQSLDEAITEAARARAAPQGN